MARVGRLNPMSAKRRRDLVGAGVVPYSTFATASPSRTAGKPARPVDTGPDKATVEAVQNRDHGRCALCGQTITGQRGWHWSVQHRRPRRRDGRRSDTNSPANLVLLCGAATGCNSVVESLRTDALQAGLLLHADNVPSLCPVRHAVHGWCLLGDDGGWVSALRPLVAVTPAVYVAGCAWKHTPTP